MFFKIINKTQVHFANSLGKKFALVARTRNLFKLGQISVELNLINTTAKIERRKDRQTDRQNNNEADRHIYRKMRTERRRGGRLRERERERESEYKYFKITLVDARVSHVVASFGRVVRLSC